MIADPDPDRCRSCTHGRSLHDDSGCRYCARHPMNHPCPEFVSPIEKVDALDADIEEIQTFRSEDPVAIVVQGRIDHAPSTPIFDETGTGLSTGR